VSRSGEERVEVRRRINEARESANIDGVTALMMALDRADDNPHAPRVALATFVTHRSKTRIQICSGGTSRTSPGSKYGFASSTSQMSVPSARNNRYRGTETSL